MRSPACCRKRPPATASCRGETRILRCGGKYWAHRQMQMPLVSTEAARSTISSPHLPHLQSQGDWGGGSGKRHEMHPCPLRITILRGMRQEYKPDFLQRALNHYSGLGSL